MKYVKTITESGYIFISASELRILLTQHIPALRGLIDHTGKVEAQTSIGPQLIDGVRIDCKTSKAAQETIV